MEPQPPPPQPQPQPPQPPPQVLLLVRHGQSAHNISTVAQYGDQGDDPTLYDACLSELGENQAAALEGHAELAATELIVASPHTRALQTLQGAFPAAGTQRCPPVEVWPLVCEHMTDSCDIGTGASALARRFPTLDFSSVPEVWWYTDDETSRSDPEDSRRRYKEFGFMEPQSAVEARVAQFADALRVRPERTIAVFGHSDFINLFLEIVCAQPDVWLDNGQVYRVELPSLAESAAGST